MDKQIKEYEIKINELKIEQEKIIQKQKQNFINEERKRKKENEIISLRVRLFYLSNLETERDYFIRQIDKCNNSISDFVMDDETAELEIKYDYDY
jgi:hypothetical protein